MHKDQDTLTLRIDLNGKVTIELKRLQQKWGFQSYTETIRRLITDRAEAEGLSVPIELD